MSAPGQPRVTPERILQMAWGYSAPILLEAAIRLRLFDVLDEKPLTAEEVAARTGTSARGVRFVLNALRGLGFVAHESGGRYALAPDTATYLVSGKQRFIGGFLRHTVSEVLPSWLTLADVVRSGKPTEGINRPEQGAEFFERFVEDLFPLNYPPALMLAGELQLAKSTAPVRVLDLATGSGVWGIALAKASGLVKVTAVDLPGVLGVTRRVAERHGVGGQFEYVGGDLHTVDFGKGYQVATLGHILHSEGATKSRALLQKTFEALAPGGTIAIQEFLVEDDRSGPPQGLLFAINMLVHTEEGDTFSFPEISGWLKESGFEKMRLLEGPGPSPMVLANRPL